MRQTLYSRVLISVGLGVLVALGATIIAELMLRAVNDFGWGVIVGGAVSTTIALFIIDTVTSAFTPPQQ